MAIQPMSAFWQLPPLPQPPHDPTWWLLDSRVGWKAGKLDQITLTSADGRLGLSVIPGTGRLLTESSGSFGGLAPPGNVALEPGGSIYLMNAGRGEVKRFDACTCQFQTVPCLGGLGSDPRQVQDPHGIALCSGNLFVCDTGNHRLQVFSLRGFVLRGAWAPPATAGLTNPWEPYGVALDGRGRVFVSDPANACIHRFRASGEWEACFPGFGTVRWITFDCRDRLYALVEGESAVRISDANGKPLGTTERPGEVAEFFAPLPFSVDAWGDLNLGGLCTPPLLPGVFDPSGARVAAPPKDPAVAFQKLGTYWSESLDSDLYRCQWHRVVIRGEVPHSTAVRVSTFTSEVDQATDQILNLPDDAWAPPLTVSEMPDGEWDGLIFSGPGRFLWLRLELAGNGAGTPWIESVRVEYPRISLRRFLPAAFGEDPGGADLTDRFLSLFDTTLRSVEKEIDNEASYFDPMSTPAIPDPKTGVDFLSWLAAWIGVSLDHQWPERKRRLFLKRAGHLFPIRGTRLGLWRELLLLLGMKPKACCCPNDLPRTTCVPKPLNCAPPSKQPCAWELPPLILEHYQLRRWLFVGAGRLGDQAVLWGRRIVNRSQLAHNAQAGVTQLITTPDPFRDPFHVYAHKFSVFVPASCGASDSQRRALLNLLESEKPAHTQYQVEYVGPRFRIGFQSMIGLDAVVGRYPAGFTFGETALGQGSVLSAPPERRGQPSFEIGTESRIGSTTLLD